MCVDSAYFSADSYDHIIPTAWIPLLDVDADNGTLQVTHSTSFVMSSTHFFLLCQLSPCHLATLTAELTVITVALLTHNAHLSFSFRCTIMTQLRLQETLLVRSLQ